MTNFNQVLNYLQDADLSSLNKKLTVTSENYVYPFIAERGELNSDGYYVLNGHLDGKTNEYNLFIRFDKSFIQCGSDCKLSVDTISV